MTITYPAEPLLHRDTLYRLAPDGDEEVLYDADNQRKHYHLRMERRTYQVIEGHLYYPVTDGPVDIWEGRDVYAGRSVA